MKGLKRNKTVIALAVAATLSIGVVGCDGVGSKTDAEHIAAAKDFLDKNDLKSGVIELKSALQKNPQNAEARRLLGEANLEAGDGAAAEKELKRALELGVAKEAIVASLAESLAIQGKYQEILDQIEAPANLDPVEKAEIISYRGDAWLSKRKPEKARAEYERALEIDAESGKAKLGLAKLAVANKKREEAGKLIAEALKSSPEDSNIWLFQAELQRAKGEIDKAEESYGQAIKLDSRNLMARYERALLRIGKKSFDNAEKDIEVLKKEVPKSFQRHYAEGMLAFYQKKFPEAQAALDESLKLNGNFVQAVFFRGVAHLAQNHLSQAENDLSRVQSAFPNAIKPRQLLAQLKIQKKEYKAAKELLDPVIKFKPDDVQTLNLLGNAEFGLGNNEQGMEYLQKLLELKPDNAGVRAKLGMGLLNSGELSKGIEQLEQAVELAPNFVQGDAFIVMAHLKAKEYGKAEKVIEKIKVKQADSPLADNLTGMVELAKGEQEQAKKTFEAVLVKFPGNPAAANALADMAFKNKNYEAVRKLYSEILEQHPKHLKTTLRLAALDALENKPKEMEALLNKAIEDHPQALQPRLILSRYYTRYGQAGRAQTLLEEVKGQYGNNPQLLSTLFEAQLTDKNITRALDTAKQLVDVAPKSAQAQFMLASAYAANHELANTRLTLAKAIELDSSHIKARMAMVKLMALNGKSREASLKLTELVKEFPEQLEITNLQGWLALRNVEPKKAAIFYQKVFEKQPSTRVVLNYVKATWFAGAKQESVAILEQWCGSYPEDIGGCYTLSAYYQALGNEQASLKVLKKILKVNPEYIPALNDLAWKIRKEDPVKALELSEFAYQKAPEHVFVMDTLAMVLAENGNLKRGLSIQEQALRIAPNVQVLKYHMAILLDKNDQRGKAIETLKELLGDPRAFEMKDEAENLLKRFINE